MSQPRPRVALTTAGGVITALCASGRQWLLPDISDRAARRASETFIAPGMGAWDECVPSVAACVVDGEQIPDHGRAWLRHWDASPDDWWSVGVGDARDPGQMVFRRRVKTCDNAVVLDYQLHNYGRTCRPMLWSAHPQFRASGTAVEFHNPHHAQLEWVTGVVVEPDGAARGDVMVRGGWEELWATVPPGGGGKFFLNGSQVRMVSLRHDSGVALEMAWEGAPVKYLGVWIDRGLYAREEVVAIEPATGWADSAAEAAATGNCLVLPPDTDAEWRIALRTPEG